MPDQIQRLKQAAAASAVDFVESGMVVGLGSGSTASLALERLVERLKQGQVRYVLGVPTSRRIETKARHLGVPLTTLEVHPVIDLTIDGADEVGPDLDLIKGGGGALLREKIVAQASRREIIVVDDSKLSLTLGTKWPLPVEIVPFGWRTQVVYLQELGANVRLRTGEDGAPFRTDGDNYILDCDFGPIADPAGLAARLSRRPGIVEHGLFVGLTTDVIVAGSKGIHHHRV